MKRFKLKRRGVPLLGKGTKTKSRCAPLSGLVIGVGVQGKYQVIVVATCQDSRK